MADIAQINNQHFKPSELFEQMLKFPDCNISKSTNEDGTIEVSFSEKKGKQIISGNISKNQYGTEINYSSYKKPRKKADFKNEAKRLYRKGYTQNEIARKLGISQPYVSNLLNR